MEIKFSENPRRISREKFLNRAGKKCGHGVGVPVASPALAFYPPAEVGNSRAERLRNSDDAEDAGIADPSFNAADVARIEIGFFS